jgi:hypothetical protein
MTRDEAEEAGALVAALREHERSTDDLAEAMNADPGQLIGISLSNELSDAGASGIGLDVALPAEMAKSIWIEVGQRIERRMAELGVTRD